MPRMWKKDEIDRWTLKAHKYVYKSDYLAGLPDTHAVQTRYAHVGRR